MLSIFVIISFYLICQKLSSGRQTKHTHTCHFFSSSLATVWFSVSKSNLTFHPSRFHSFNSADPPTAFPLFLCLLSNFASPSSPLYIHVLLFPPIILGNFFCHPYHIYSLTCLLHLFLTTTLHSVSYPFQIYFVSVF